MTPMTPSGERVLVVDDEPDIVALVAYHLAKAGYRVATASSGTDALESARRERPAIIVLDLMLPGMSGYEVLEQLRANEATRDVAVLMLTARREEADRIQGLSLGADDYLTKPFSPQELVLRVGAILRRLSAGGATSGDRLQIGALQIDLGAHQVKVDGDPVDLTPTEFKLLAKLAQHPGRVFTRTQLLDAVRGDDAEAFDRSIDAHIKNIRRKLEADPRRPHYVLTVYGVGYKSADALITNTTGTGTGTSGAEDGDRSRSVRA